MKCSHTGMLHSPQWFLPVQTHVVQVKTMAQIAKSGPAPFRYLDAFVLLIVTDIGHLHTFEDLGPGF